MSGDCAVAHLKADTHEGPLLAEMTQVERPLEGGPTLTSAFVGQPARANRR